MTSENRYILGKCDYNGLGRKNCEAAFTWVFRDGQFSMCAEIWNPKKTDIYAGGQCIEEVLKYFPGDKRAQEMASVWRRYHLNNMKEGSPAQMAHLEARPRPSGISHYDWALATLKAVGLEPDPGYIHNGKPYSYGSAWLKSDIPPDVIAAIESWGTGEQAAGDADTASGFDAFLASHYDFKTAYVEHGERGDEYRCSFTHKNKYDEKGKAKTRLVTSFYQGIGFRKNLLGGPWNEHSERMSGAFSPARSAPSAKTVLDALIRDAQTYLDNQDLADFCENLGYGLREGRRVHAACEKTLSDLREFAGPDFSYLMNEQED